MKLFNYLLAGILCASATAVSAQHRADPQKLVDLESFSMILLGDPQGYTKYDINQPLFDLCTAWIADNIEPLKIKAVLCTGDLVEQNDNNVLNRKMLNQTSREMWEAAPQAILRPQAVCQRGFILLREIRFAEQPEGQRALFARKLSVLNDERVQLSGKRLPRYEVAE